MQSNTNVFSELYSDLQKEETFPHKKPLLAHYTSIRNLEHILNSNEVWFSNPLLMNDVQEMRFGIIEGYELFCKHNKIREVCGEDHHILLDHFKYHYNLFNEQAIDVYIFCCSEHDPKHNDGILSMWRGYGENGNGVAIVFDTKEFKENPSSPFILSKIEYASSEDRRNWINEKCIQLSELLRGIEINKDNLQIAAYMMFERLKLFTLFTKHHGFSEEQEWRFVYVKSRDRNEALESMCQYAIGKRGIEPKLKFKLEPIEGVTSSDFSLSKFVHQIILGPTISNVLTQKTVIRMLEKIRPELKDKVVASTIPFRVI